MQVREEHGSAPPPASDEARAPDSTGDDVPPASLDEGIAGQRSLFDDFEALIDDGRTYFEAELTYQKTRAGFVGNRLKKTIAFGVVAAYLAVLATIGLTMGLIIALTPYLTAWGATAVVVLALLLVAYLFVRRAGKAWSEMTGAMRSDAEGQDDG